MTSEISDSAFCHVCLGPYHKNCITVNNIESRSVSEEYTNWKNATCEGEFYMVAKNPLNTLLFSQRALKMLMKHFPANIQWKNLLIIKPY